MANQRFQNALVAEPQAVPPIWMMRQAGRYHNHYQILKQKHSFEDLCKHPELAAETAMGPIRDFDFDLAILFSDILFPLEALGMGLRYEPGPIFDWHLQSIDDLKLLLPVAEARENLVFQKTAVQLTRQALADEKSLIGFIGGPWTLFTYATAGRHSGNLTPALAATGLREALFPTLIHLLRENIALQLEGGAEIVMVFDTAAGALAPALFKDIVIPGLQDFAAAYPGKIGYYAKGITGDHLAMVREVSGLAGFGVDHGFNMQGVLHSERTLKRRGFVQGNFDQHLLFMDRADFIKSLKQFMQPLKELSLTERAGWVCGLGHGVLPGTPEEHVRLFVDTIREEFA